jgi:hypothetical protein
MSGAENPEACADHGEDRQDGDDGGESGKRQQLRCDKTVAKSRREGTFTLLCHKPWTNCSIWEKMGLEFDPK